jgi:hypothetical protein
MIGVVYQDNLKEHLLINLHKLLVPLLNVRSLLSRIGVVIGSCRRVVLVMLAPLDDLLKDRLIDLCGNGCVSCQGALSEDCVGTHVWNGNFS